MNHRRVTWMRLWPGVLLVVLGVLFLVTSLTGAGGVVIPLVIGGLLLTFYGISRGYGFLVPGAILLGLGLGIVAETWLANGGVVLLGLGLGFYAIYVVDRLVVRRRWEARWWPLVPGTILAAIGALLLIERTVWLAWIGNWWALLLVALGILLLWGALRRKP